MIKEEEFYNADRATCAIACLVCDRPRITNFKPRPSLLNYEGGANAIFLEHCQCFEIYGNSPPKTEAASTSGELWRRMPGSLAGTTGRSFAHAGRSRVLKLKVGEQLLLCPRRLSITVAPAVCASREGQQGPTLVAPAALLGEPKQINNSPW
jgi:hypothetical protein